jgi:hypothetical protein
MPYLDAALAFALTMLAVSTLVTQIVRLFRNTAKLRRQGLQDMLKDFFSNELQPVIQRELNRLKLTVGDQVVNGIKETLAKFDASPQLTKAVEEKLTDMTTEEIAERLKRTELGQRLLTDLGDKAQAVFDELGKRYEAAGRRATESFRSKSRWWSLGVGVIVAFALNIDSIFIANTYMKNEGMRQAVIAQKDSLEAGYTELEGKLEADEKKDSISKDEFDQAFQDAKAQLDIFTSAGFPIGYNYYPYVCLKEPETSICTERGMPASITVAGRKIPLGDLNWFIGIILTSLLAGLGGPFWYDVVAGISRAVQSTRAAAKKPEG